MAGIPTNTSIEDDKYLIGEKNIIAANVLAIICLFIEIFI